MPVRGAGANPRSRLGKLGLDAPAAGLAHASDRRTLVLRVRTQHLDGRAVADALRVHALRTESDAESPRREHVPRVYLAPLEPARAARALFEIRPRGGPEQIVGVTRLARIAFGGLHVVEEEVNGAPPPSSGRAVQENHTGTSPLCGICARSSKPSRSAVRSPNVAASSCAAPANPRTVRNPAAPTVAVLSGAISARA